MENLQDEGKVQYVEIEGWGEGYISSQGMKDFEANDNVKSVYMLDKSDILVRSYLSELKQIYIGLEVLQYLLIDGEFKGAVLGHWRIGPYDIEDIHVDLIPEEAATRKAEIIDAVRKIYSPDRTAILNYNGQKLV